MPGDVYLTNDDYAAGFGYAGYASTGAAQTQVVGGGAAGYSHTAFVVWLLVFTLSSVAVLHGLRVGGFTFVFKR